MKSREWFFMHPVVEYNANTARALMQDRLQAFSFVIERTVQGTQRLSQFGIIRTCSLPDWRQVCLVMNGLRLDKVVKSKMFPPFAREQVTPNHILVALVGIALPSRF